MTLYFAQLRGERAQELCLEIDQTPCRYYQETELLLTFAKCEQGRTLEK